MAGVRFEAFVLGAGVGQEKQQPGAAATPRLLGQPETGHQPHRQAAHR